MGFAISVKSREHPHSWDDVAEKMKVCIFPLSKPSLSFYQPLGSTWLFSGWFVIILTPNSKWTHILSEVSVFSLFSYISMYKFDVERVKLLTNFTIKFKETASNALNVESRKTEWYNPKLKKIYRVGYALFSHCFIKNTVFPLCQLNSLGNIFCFFLLNFYLDCREWKQKWEREVDGIRKNHKIFKATGHWEAVWG